MVQKLRWNSVTPRRSRRVAGWAVSPADQRRGNRGGASAAWNGMASLRPSRFESPGWCTSRQETPRTGLYPSGARVTRRILASTPGSEVTGMVRSDTTSNRQRTVGQDAKAGGSVEQSGTSSMENHRGITNLGPATLSSEPLADWTRMLALSDPPVARITARSSALSLPSPLLPTRPRRLRSYRERVPLVLALNTYRGTLDILRLLERIGEATKYAMSRRLPTTRKGIASSVRCLEWLGLIEEAPRDSTSKPYCLTELGRDIVARPIRALPAWVRIPSSSVTPKAIVAPENPVNLRTRRATTR